MSGIRIWYQSYMDAESAGAYWERLREHLSSIADAGTAIDVHGITPHDSYPHALVEWRCGREVICNAIEAERQGYDAFIIGHFQDAGLYEARGAVEIPVLGLGETSMLYACQLGQRLGLVTFKSAYIPWFRHQIARYGLRERITGIHSVTVTPDLFAAAMSSKDGLQKLYQQVANDTRPLLASGIDVLVPTGGGPMMLLAGLKDIDGAPVIDGTAIAVKMAEVAVKLKRMTGLGTSRRGEFAKAPPAVLEEFLAHPKGL